MTSTLPDLLPAKGYAASPRFHPAIWPLTAHADDDGRLCIGEVALTEIADEFGTPAYAVDEADFRARARRYRAALGNAEVVYAGKSLLTIGVARWAHEEGLGVDVCSAGEMATAMAGGVDKAQIVLHPSLQLIGFHCHLGSQVTDAAIYGEAIHRVIAAMAHVRASHGVTVTELNIGGGHGIPYLSGDPELDVDELSRTIAA